MMINVQRVQNSEKAAVASSLRETALVSFSGLCVVAVFYLLNVFFSTRQTSDGLEKLLHHFEVVPVYLPLVGGFVAALAIALEALTFEATKRWPGVRTGWVKNVIGPFLEGMAHLHAFPLLPMVGLVAFAGHSKATMVTTWLSVGAVLLVAVLCGLVAKLYRTSLATRNPAERIGPYAHLALWLVVLRWGVSHM